MNSIKLNGTGKAILHQKGATEYYSVRLLLAGGFIAETDNGQITVTRQDMQTANVTISSPVARFVNLQPERTKGEWETIEWILSNR